MYGLQHEDIMTGHFRLGVQRESAKCDNSIKVTTALINPQHNLNRSNSSPDLQLCDFSRLYIWPIKGTSSAYWRGIFTSFIFRVLVNF